MVESVVNPNMSFGENSNSEFSILNLLENGNYLKPHYVEKELQVKIEEFSNWFNSTAVLCLLRCNPAAKQGIDCLLQNLEKNIKFARLEINKTVSNSKQSFTCRVCGEMLEIQPGQHFWSTLQNHPHFEEIYSQSFDVNLSNAYDNFENGESTNDSTIEDLSEDLSHLDLSQVSHTEPNQNGLDEFKFNFQIAYDTRIEEALYPESITLATRRRDNVAEYTVQRCGANRCVCLICPCNLISKGRSNKITTFVVKNHVTGQRHLKSATSNGNVNVLKRYHDFWKSQDVNYQAHQVHFMPEIYSRNDLRCQLCQTYVNYDAVISHINSTLHGKRVVKIFHSTEGKLNEYYLLDMQVQIYGDMINDFEEKPNEEPKTGANGNNKPAPATCHFVKFTEDPNNLTLPNRYKEHLTFFKKASEGQVNCSACRVSLDDNLAKIKIHIVGPQHKQLSGLTVLKYTFFCEICNAHIKDEAAWEDHFIRGPNRHSSMSKARQQKVAEYECKTCKIVIYGDDMSLTRHISRGGKPGRPKEIKLPISVMKLFKNSTFVEEQGVALQSLAARVAEQQDKMRTCLTSLEGAVSVIYPFCKAYPFGSRISGLGNDNSDLDVFMDVDNMYLGEDNQDSQSQEQFVKKVSKLLKTYKDVSYVLSIPSARTPIVRLRHNPTGLDCDISFRHGLGVENTKFLRFCIQIQPITQSFILLLRKWLKCCELNEHLPHYGLALMAVFYLQTRNYLLSVKTIRAYNPSPSLVIDGWETLNYTVPVEEMQKYVRPCKESVKVLLTDFFHYFSKFDYANMVVCPLLGNLVPKLLFYESPHDNLPPEMNSYKQKIMNENAEEFRGLSPFCIQDPFDLSHNLTKACQHGTITKLKTCCTLTYDFLVNME